MLETAVLTFNSGHLTTVINRTYYAAFHAMKAVLLFSGYDSSKHSGIIAEFNRLYIKTGIFDKKYSLLIKKLFDERNDSDYDYTFTADAESTALLLAQTREFAAQVKAHIKNITKEA